MELASAGRITSKFAMFSLNWSIQALVAAMAPCKLTFTRVVVVLFLLYLGYNCFIIYSIFRPSECNKSQGPRCILPAYAKDEKLQARSLHKPLQSQVLMKYRIICCNTLYIQLWVYTSLQMTVDNTKDLKMLLHVKKFLRTQEIKK